MDTYYYPTGPETNARIQDIWNQLTNNSRGAPQMIEVAQGRNLMIPKAAKNVAQVDFYDLCDTPKGSTDFMALAQNFNTVIIRRVP